MTLTCLVALPVMASIQVSIWAIENIAVRQAMVHGVQTDAACLS